MDLHTKIRTIYLEKFLRPVQKSIKVLENIMLEGNSFDCPDIARKSNYENKIKYLDPTYAKRVADKLFKIMPNELTGPKLDILDVGCGFGQYSLIFKEFGHNVVGTLGGRWYTKDYKFILMKLGIEHIDINLEENFAYKLSIDLWKYPEQFKEFDIIFCSEVLTLPSVVPFTRHILTEFLDLITINGRIILLNHHNKFTKPSIEYYQ